MEAGVTHMSSTVLRDESEAMIGSRLVRELYDDEDPCGGKGGWSHWHILKGKHATLGLWFDPETVANMSKFVPKKKGVYEYGVSFQDNLEQIIVLYAGKGGGSRSHGKSPEPATEKEEDSEATEATEVGTPPKAKADTATLHQRICNGYLSNGSDSGREFIALLSLGLCVRFRWLETDDPKTAEETMLAKYDYALCSAKNNMCRELDTVLMPLPNLGQAKFPLTCTSLVQCARYRAHKLIANMTLGRSVVECLGLASAEQQIALGAVATFVGSNGDLLPGPHLTLPSQCQLSLKEFNLKLKECGLKEGATKEQAKERWMRKISNTLTPQDRSPQRGSRTTQQRLNFGDASGPNVGN
jgi:hypothetical protein